MPPHTPITVVLAHFDDLFAGGLRTLIESDPSLTIVAADVEYRRIPVVLRAHRPDVAILDVGALGKLAEVRQLNSSHPATRLVLLGNAPSPVECAQLLAFGASACLGRETQSRDVINAIHLASRGLQVTPRIAASAGEGVTASSRAGSVAGEGLLSKRQAEVLVLLQEGNSNAQIALVLHVGVETVRTHARHIYRKLGVSSRRELIAELALVPDRRPITGEQTTLPVLGHSTGAGGASWLRVMLPGRPDGSTGWIAQNGTRKLVTGWRILVDIAARRVSVYRDGHPVRSFAAVVGKPSTPTPTGQFFVEETVQMASGQPGGPFALALSARSNVLQEFEGGPGQIALHGRDNLGGTLGAAESHGCMRLDTTSIDWLTARIGPGVPVKIFAG